MQPTPRGKRILTPIVVLFVVNFFAFFAGCLVIGGSAPNGKVEDGKYFVGDHGNYTEVSYAVYVYSFAHTNSIFITLAALVMAGTYLIWAGDILFW